MIYLFALDSLQHTVFKEAECLKFFEQNGIMFTSEIGKADIFILRYIRTYNPEELDQMIIRNPIPPKPILLWTHEPKFCKTDKNFIQLNGSYQIHIMSLYTGDVHVSNLTFYGKNVDQILQPISRISFSKKPIVALATYVFEDKQQLLINGTNVDLTVKRQNLILEGYRNGVLDIYGTGWPSDVAIGESRGEGWHKTKLKILQDYQFNVALENTSFNYYCTEKIWDSIKSYCLPVYSSYNNKIKDIFPDGTFIDYDHFESNTELLYFIKMMSEKEYIYRLNACIEIFNNLYLKVDFNLEKEKTLQKVVERIYTITKMSSD
jgi:alpha(1,3/1,4) fucosyltransferase